MYLEAYANHSLGVQIMAIINLQCSSLSQIFRLKVVVVAENSHHGYQTTLAQRFLIIEGSVCLVNERIGARGMVF